MGLEKERREEDRAEWEGRASQVQVE